VSQCSTYHVIGGSEGCCGGEEGDGGGTGIAQGGGGCRWLVIARVGVEVHWGHER
jgi:hypothetical protein